MMIKNIIGGVAIITVIAFVICIIIWQEMDDRKHKEAIRCITGICLEKIYRDSIPKFSVEEHYKKLEEVTKEIVQQRKKNDYTITLWLLDDGLMINDNGTTEWIKRYERELGVPIEVKNENGEYNYFINIVRMYRYLNEI